MRSGKSAGSTWAFEKQSNRDFIADRRSSNANVTASQVAGMTRPPRCNSEWEQISQEMEVPAVTMPAMEVFAADQRTHQERSCGPFHRLFACRAFRRASFFIRRHSWGHDDPGRIPCNPGEARCALTPASPIIIYKRGTQALSGSPNSRAGRWLVNCGPELPWQKFAPKASPGATLDRADSLSATRGRVP
jgi:hypothetical protein